MIGGGERLAAALRRGGVGAPVEELEGGLALELHGKTGKLASGSARAENDGKWLATARWSSKRRRRR